MSDFYNKYPYTDFHELNLDWVIERVKKLTEDWAATSQEWDDTEAAWNDLHDYVMNYFNNLDVQEEINHKLDVMAADGTLDALLLPYFNAYKVEINGIVDTQNNRIVDIDNELTSINSRISEIANLPAGSTSGDAELIDIRTPANGFNGNVAYDDAGDAVRGQITSLDTASDEFADNFTHLRYIGLRLQNGYYTISNIDGSLQYHSSSYHKSASVDVTEKSIVYISLNHMTDNDSIIFTDSNDNVIMGYLKRSDTAVTVTNLMIMVPYGASRLYMTSAVTDSVFSVAIDDRVTSEMLNKANKQLSLASGLTDVFETISVTETGYSRFISTGQTKVVMHNSSDASSFVTASLPCNPGEEYIASFRHTTLLDSIIIADKDLNILVTHYPQSVASVNVNDYRFKIPADGAVLCLSSTTAVPISLKRSMPFRKQIVVDINGSGDYTKISDAILNATPGTDIYVKPGTYDMITELGSAYFNAYTWDPANPVYGLTMPANSSITFSSGAKLICNYTGNNDDIKEQWSPIASNKGDVQYIGINIEASNVKYCIHDEHGGDPNPYKVLFDRCNLYLDDSNNPLSYSKSCIGGGFGWYGDVEVKNCVVESVGTSVGGTISYHTQTGGNGATCKANIHNNYCIGADNTVRVYSAYTGSGTQYTYANVNNNSLGKAYMTDNIVTSYAYLNEIHA